MSTQPTAIGLTAQGVITMDGSNEALQVAAANAELIDNYKNVIVPDWLMKLTQATPELPAPPPPAQLMLVQFDQAAFTNALTEWNNTAFKGVNPGNPNVQVAFTPVPYPIDPRILSAQSPPTSQPQPDDPVGAYMFGNVYAVKAGDESPIGTIVPASKDSRGPFCKAKNEYGPFLAAAMPMVYEKIG